MRRKNGRHLKKSSGTFWGENIISKMKKIIGWG